MYPRNNASPPRIAVGAVVQISDGAVQTADVLIKVTPEGGSASAGSGTTSYVEGVVHYVPTQAETNYTAFTVTAHKADCIPTGTTVVTTAASTAGQVVTDEASRTASKATGFATPEDVSPTIDFDPTINPTTLDSTAVDAIRDGLATQTSLNAVAAVTAKLGMMIQDDGEGNWQYTVIAVAKAPTGNSEITVNAVVSVPAVVAESAAKRTGEIIRSRGTRWLIAIEELGDLTGVEKLYLTIKGGDVADAAANLQIALSIPASVDDGLLRVNGEAANDKTMGSLEVESYVADDEAVKNRVIVTVNEKITKLMMANPYRYDLKQTGEAAGAEVLANGRFRVIADTTRAVS
ncbi:hypothetical protein Pla52o_35190 [Novipirellula galeiformis]|uniref:Uncharacterized protein n=1 Tax=Novipirellula galeiformis TaxID=2528004 RepID=A0A5C6CCD7_9BACT|nr:hypothetical protein [Novipirellula galeiformis]TWU22463.1 hypothetical protein Pla52o_35190 [Novipirellula galeiformis]